MKRFNVRYAETFLWDMIDITLYLLDKTESVAVSKRFYDKTLQSSTLLMCWRNLRRDYKVISRKSKMNEIIDEMNGLIYFLQPVA